MLARSLRRTCIRACDRDKTANKRLACFGDPAAPQQAAVAAAGCCMRLMHWSQTRPFSRAQCRLQAVSAAHTTWPVFVSLTRVPCFVARLQTVPAPHLLCFSAYVMHPLGCVFLCRLGGDAGAFKLPLEACKHCCQVLVPGKR